MHLERMPRPRLHRARHHRQRHEGELQVGMLDAGAAADEATGLDMRRSARRAGLVQEPLQPGQVLARRARLLGQGYRLLAGVLGRRCRMIAEIGADARQVALDRDPEPCSRSAGPMPESCSSCGLLIAPPHRMTSRSAVAVAALAADRIGNAGGALAVDQEPLRGAPVTMVRLGRCAPRPDSRARCSSARPSCVCGE